jgi:hypothetical protein
MKYKEFKDIHKGCKIIVSGCGMSATDLKNPQDYITIAVNDIGRIYTPNYLVVLNSKSSFPAERWQWIGGSTCPYIFTHIKELDVSENQRVVVQLGRYGGHDLEKEAVDFTSHSTYVALIIAAYMGATKIGILGCDFTNGHFFAKSGEHSLSRKINTINQELGALKDVMSKKGIELVNLSQISRITSIPKQALIDF